MRSDDDGAEQLTLVRRSVPPSQSAPAEPAPRPPPSSAPGTHAASRPAARAAPPRTPRPPTEVATHLPVARVVLDVGLAHLDRPFDYAVPAPMSDDAGPGTRVRLRFAGQEVGGFVVERRETSDHLGRLTPIRRVVSPEPVLMPEILRVARQVADHYAGTLADVLRLAVPPRHARVEKEALRMSAARLPPTPPENERWSAYQNGPQLLAALSGGATPRAVWAALPGPDPASGQFPRWPGDIAIAVRACLASDRAALVVVADTRDVALVASALDAELGTGSHVALTAELGPAERYRRWLTIRRGFARVVVGTRAAAFAPVADLGLVVLWDDGDDLHAEPRAPYHHVREVLRLRAVDAGAAAIFGGLAVTAEGAELVRTGWARAVRPTTAIARSAGPLVRIADEDGGRDQDALTRRARLPTLAFDTARSALAHGPVLIQVPRAGYVPSLLCSRCRTPARCTHCRGPLGVQARGGPRICRWCGRTAEEWRCEECGNRTAHAPVIGAARTAEELGRAFPSVPVISSGGSRVVPQVGPSPALVVATTGAEPVAEGGYAAALLLDGWLLLGRADLRAGEEALRRWLAAAALVRGGAAGGRLVLMAPPDARAAQAFLRADPFGAAERELADRSSAGLPPAVRLATVTGDPAAVEELLAVAELPAGSEVLGSVPVSEDEVRTVIRVKVDQLRRAARGTGSRTQAAAGNLAAALHAGQALRSARKSAGTARIQIDPLELG